MHPLKRLTTSILLLSLVKADSPDDRGLRKRLVDSARRQKAKNDDTGDKDTEIFASELREAAEGGPTAIEGRIVGGQPAPAGAYPFFVHTDEANTACGGSLIHPDIVLTAASCIGLWTGDAVIGSIFYENLDGSETMPIESENPHPDYNETSYENDIMIVKLAAPSSAPLISTNKNNFLPFTGTGVTVIGFGATSDGGEVSLALLELNIETLDFGVCQENLDEELFPATQMCAGDLGGGLDRCQGDSGKRF